MAEFSAVDGKPGPVEVWLTQTNMEITGQLVFEDESARVVHVESLSMRGAQRETTAWLIDLGYEPAGRWGTEYESERDGIEVVRRFRPGQGKEEEPAAR